MPKVCLKAEYDIKAPVNYLQTSADLQKMGKWSLKQVD